MSPTLEGTCTLSQNVPSGTYSLYYKPNSIHIMGFFVHVCIYIHIVVFCIMYCNLPCLLVVKFIVKDRAHLSTFKIFIFEKFSCFIVLVVFLVIVQSSELVSVWFCEKMTFFPNFFSYHIFAIYVGAASLGLPIACRLIAVSGARLPSVDGLVVRCIKMHHHVKSAITICLQFI